MYKSFSVHSTDLKAFLYSDIKNHERWQFLTLNRQKVRGLAFINEDKTKRQDWRTLYYERSNKTKT